MQARFGQVIVYVTDMARSLAFYRDALGLPVRYESEGWSEFETRGVGLALHRSSTADPAGASRVQPAGRAELSFAVADLDGAVASLRERGIDVQGPRLLEGINLRVALLRDPDGLSVVLTEQPA